MTTFARLNGLTSILYTPMLMAVGIMTTIPAHAEQYCKSVDQSGNASYTLAPESGCNKKKFKTIAVSHHITPQIATQATNTPNEKHADAPPAVTTTPNPAVVATPESASVSKISTENSPVTKQPNKPLPLQNKD